MKHSALSDFFLLVVVKSEIACIFKLGKLLFTLFDSVFREQRERAALSAPEEKVFDEDLSAEADQDNAAHQFCFGFVARAEYVSDL